MVHANRVAVLAANTNSGMPRIPRVTGAITGDRMPFVNGFSTGTVRATWAMGAPR